MKHLSLAVVGVQYENKRGPTRRFAIEVLKPGDPIKLEHEPRNKADPHAIAVFNEAGVQLGYLTAERAPMIRRFLEEGRPIETVFQRRAEFGCWIRAALDGEPMQLPTETLPASKAEIDADRVVVRGEFDQREWED